MSRKLTLHGKSVEVSDEDADSLMHMGAEIALALTHTVFNGEAAKKLRGPQRGHAPRAVKEEGATQGKTDEAKRLPTVVARMRSMYAPKVDE